MKEWLLLLNLKCKINPNSLALLNKKTFDFFRTLKIHKKLMDSNSPYSTRAI